MTPAYAYLSGSGAADAVLDVIDDLGVSFASVASAEIAKEEGWIVQIELESIVSVGRTITLHYNNVKVQRHLTIPDDEPARIEAYSGAIVAVDVTYRLTGRNDTIPQYPADEPKDVTVDYAANGSGMVKFALG